MKEPKIRYLKARKEKPINDNQGNIVIYQTEDGNTRLEVKMEVYSVVRNFRTTANDGKNYNVTYYSLDMIISLGYRIKSIVATHFRRWATERLKEYIIRRKRWEITTKNTGSDSLKTSPHPLI